MNPLPKHPYSIDPLPQSANGTADRILLLVIVLGISTGLLLIGRAAWQMVQIARDTPPAQVTAVVPTVVPTDLPANNSPFLPSKSSAARNYASFTREALTETGKAIERLLQLFGEAHRDASVLGSTSWQARLDVAIREVKAGGALLKSPPVQFESDGRQLPDSLAPLQVKRERIGREIDEVTAWLREAFPNLPNADSVDKSALFEAADHIENLTALFQDAAAECNSID